MISCNKITHRRISDVTCHDRTKSFLSYLSNNVIGSAISKRSHSKNLSNSIR
nr:MAG TPA: hypothetical protein [Caudoviricetes sp.]